MSRFYVHSFVYIQLCDKTYCIIIFDISGNLILIIHPIILRYDNEKSCELRAVPANESFRFES